HEIREAIEQGSSQFSKKRPGVIWTHFVDVTTSELDSLIATYRAGTPTLLEGVAYRMFLSDRHDHVAALLFSAEAPVSEQGGPRSLIIQPKSYSQRGTLYPLWNTRCRLNQPMVEMF